MLSGSNGVAFSQYYILTSTNLALPLASWTSIATNTFDLNGSFAFTNSLTPPVRQRFYQIHCPKRQLMPPARLGTHDSEVRDKPWARAEHV